VSQDAGQAAAGPREEIERRLDARRAALAVEARWDAAVAGGRLAAFASGAALAALAFGWHRLSAAWLAAPAAAYFALAVLHEAVLRRRARLARAVSFHQAALDRLAERWSGRGSAGERFAQDDHPYARDLDLFGPGSLFELLCAARTRPGEEALAAWLLAPAAPDEVRARQTAVAELAPGLDLREDLAVLGEDVRAEVDPERLAAWGEAPPLLGGPWIRVAALALPLAALATLLGWVAGRISPLPFAAALLAEWALLRATGSGLTAVLGAVERPSRELTVLALLLARLEREPFRSEKLRGLQAELSAGSAPASAHLARLSRLASLSEWAHNQFYAPIAFVLLWKLHLALALERWRTGVGPRLRRWLGAVGELEGLSSLAGHAHLNPGDPFPEVAGSGALFRAEGLGHPLLPRESCVHNDLALGGGARLVLVSGSNMSGKSTLLRTVGVNAVLALAGGPVRARRLSLSPLSVGATLRIQDSLQAGRSRFYAEITRLRTLADLAAGPRPLLFLLDELLHGTNSRDRRIGAEAVLRGLLAHGALGLVTTHDLALTELAGALPGAANAHFEDRMEEGRIAFDYRLRPGVVTGSNALALMRAVGLDVGP
jgi:hypothetical protein